MYNPSDLEQPCPVLLTRLRFMGLINSHDLVCDGFQRRDGPGLVLLDHVMHVKGHANLLIRMLQPIHTPC